MTTHKRITPVQPKALRAKRPEPYVLYGFGWGRECCVSATGKLFFRNRPRDKSTKK